MMAPLVTLKAQAKPDQLRDFTQGALGNFTNNGAIYSRSIEVDEVKGLATIHAKGIGNLWWNRDEEHPYLAIEGMVGARSEEHTSELQSLMRISYAVFCLKKKNKHEASIA